MFLSILGFEVVGNEVNALSEKVRIDLQHVFEETSAYVDVINLEYENSGTISSSLVRLQEELTQKRQFLLYLRQLQAELIEVQRMIQQSKVTFVEQMETFKKFVGERSSVPKEEVYVFIFVIYLYMTASISSFCSVLDCCTR